MASSISLNQIVKHLNLPLLLSIGIHGVFFMTILPDWNTNNKLSSSDGLQNTPVIEFNELEKTRLPQPKQPPATFDWNIVNTLPSQNDNSIALNIPNLPNLPPPPPLNQLPLPQINNGGIVNIPSMPPPPINFSPNNPTPTTNPLPLPQPQIYTSNYSSQLPPPPNFDGEDINQPTILDSVPTISDSDLPTYNTQPRPRISLSPEEEAKIRAEIFADSKIQIAANPRDVINGKITTPNDNNNNNNNNPNLNNSNNQSAIVQPLPQNYESLASKLEKKPENTTNDEARKNYVAWAAKVKNVKSQQVTLQGIYPKDACVRKLEGTTTYGVTVNPSGSVVSSNLIKSSGYSLFNNQALRQIQGRKFANNTGGNQPYHVYVNFNYNQNICPSLSINNLGNIPAANPPKTTPNTNTNQPQQTETKPQTTVTPVTPVTPKTNQPQQQTETKPQTTVIPVTPKTTPKTNQPQQQTETKPKTTVTPVTPKPTPKTNQPQQQTETKPQTTVIPVTPKPTPNQTTTKPQPKQTVVPVKPQNKTPTKPQPIPETKLPNTSENKANQLVIPKTNPPKTESKSITPNSSENQNKLTP